LGNFGSTPIEGPDDQPVGITRRQALKRGAIFGGALAWATPVVQIVGMRPASAQAVSPPVADVLVRVQTGANVQCFMVTQEVAECFAENCAGEPGEMGCLNQCQEDRGVGQLERVDCP
jgi:hypothetical protein